MNDNPAQQWAPPCVAGQSADASDARQQRHMDPALHAHCVETAAEIAEHFLANRLGVTFTDTAPEWLTERQAKAEGRTR